MQPISIRYLCSAALALAVIMSPQTIAPRAETPSPAVKSFLQDLRAQNEHHLRAQPGLPEEKPVPIIEPGPDDQHNSWELREGPVKLVVELRPRAGPEGTKERIPVLSVFVSNDEVAKLAAGGREGGAWAKSPAFIAQIAEMDPSNGYPEIVFSKYTGGAHCCSDTKVLTSSNGARDPWRLVEAGEFDAGPLRARDADGDGRFEIVTNDDRFFYAFSCFACSTTPLQIMRLEGDRLANVSDEPRYRARQVAWLRAMIENGDDSVDLNGFLAGYVGQKILLGEGKDAWALMLKYYDRDSDWGLKACSVKAEAPGKCPGELVKLTFPDALQRFLTRNGYPLGE